MMKNFSMHSFVGGVMLGILLTGAWFFGNTTYPPQGSLSLPTDTKKSTVESGAISVANQPPGLVVAIESLTVPPPGIWVAVREISGNDLGNVLGAARVTGPRSTVSIPLLRPTEPNLSYAVELYRDDESGSFDLAVDSVYIDFATGAPVIARFSTTN